MGIKSKGSSVPAGSMIDYGGGTVPAGWLLAYGQAVSRADYAALFLAIGVTFGAGDGVTTFNLPDTRGRAIFGKDDMGGVAANRVTVGNSGVSGDALGGVGGGESVTLTTSEMPSHNHSNGATGNVNARATGANAMVTAQNTGAQGSGGAHNNMPPALVANKIIKF